MGNGFDGMTGGGGVDDADGADGIDDADLLDVLSVETRIKILEAVAVVVFVAGWAIAAWASFDEDGGFGLGFGLDSGAPLQMRLYQMLSMGVGVTSATALIALAAIFYRGYAAWRRDRSGT